MRNWAWCVGVGLAVSLTLTWPADAAVWEITQVTDFDGLDGAHMRVKDLAVSDAFVAWGEVLEEGGVRVYDGNRIVRLSWGGPREGWPTVSEQLVVWTENTGTINTPWKLRFPDCLGRAQRRGH